MAWDKFTQRLFATDLQKLRDTMHRTNILTQFERNFVADMLDKFNSRDNAIELGIKPWEPSAKQSNYLHSIADKL